MLASVLDAIKTRQRFLVTAHARPDGDAVGSVLAMGMLLRQLGKEADMVLADRVPIIYETLPAAECIQHQSIVDAQYDAVVLLECDSVLRTRLQGIAGQFLISMDHHSSSRAFANVNWIEPHASAVAAMVYELAEAAKVNITPAMATCIYTGLLTDTGSFGYPGTHASTLRLAAALVEAGADPSNVARDVYFSNPASKMRLLGAALANLRVEGRLSWLWVTQEDFRRTQAVEEDCEGVVNYAIGIFGVDVAVFLRELPDGGVRLSLRSKNRAVNVAAIAESFGGGGHESASGCLLQGPLAAASQNILQTLKQALEQTTPARQSLSV